ncbi:alpha/beta-hydrolase, partial [Schizopora paradoxa]
WTIHNLFRSWRPRPSWRLSWCLENNFQRYVVQVEKRIGGNSPSPNDLDTDPSVHGVNVNGVPSTFITGRLKEWAEYARVSPARIPSYWLYGPNVELAGEASDPSGEKVLLYLHGGGYVAFSAHPSSPTAIIPLSILQQCEGLNIKRVFCVEYRLSSYDPHPRQNPFPAALVDALAGYVHLVNIVGIHPKNIIVVGDSAGGNLALTLVRYLVETRQSDAVFRLETPGAMILLSPWSDIGNSNSEDLENTMHTNARSDYLESPILRRNGRVCREYNQYAFAGSHGVGFLDSNVYVSPASLYLTDEEVNFEGFPPTFINCGGGELFVDQIRTLARRMRRDLWDLLVYHEAEDAVHDCMWIEWQEIHRKETLRVIERWIATL